MDERTRNAIDGMHKIENNVIQVINALLTNGTPPDTLSELGPYAKICNILIRYMPGAPERAIREKMVELVRCEPDQEAFDDLLRRKLDPQLEEQSSMPEISSDELEMPPLDYGMLDPELALGACSWLDDAYVPFSRIWSPRAPDIHHIGCGLWTLSTIALRRLAAREGRTLQHTPLYVQLVAPSSVWGKTTTARIAIDLLEQLDLGWMLSPGMITPEKFLKNMAGTSVPENYHALDDLQKEMVRIKLAHSGQRGWYYSEFGQLLREMADSRGRNALFKSILLRMDDCELTSRYDTIGRDLEEIQLPYLTLLGTMTPECMKPYSGSESSLWRGGFYARFAFCCAPFHKKKTQQDLEWEQFPSDEGKFPDEILLPLRDLHARLKLSICEIKTASSGNGNIGGYKIIREPMEAYPMTILSLHPSARQALNDYGNALILRAQDDELAQFRSYYSRLRDKTLRIATLFAALQGCDCIELKHIARAQQIVEQFRESIHQLGLHLSQVNLPSKQPEDKIMKVLAQRGPLTVREITQYIHHDTDTVRKKLDGLLENGDIIATRQGQKIVYCIVHE